MVPLCPFGFARRNIVAYLIDGGFVQGRINKMSHSVFVAEITHGIHLILHQCNKRGNNYCCAIQKQRRQLITQRFSTPGRHEHESVLAFHYVPDDSFLISFESVESKMQLKTFCQRIGFCHNYVFLLTNKFKNKSFRIPTNKGKN
jgi:hypothetical protein